jgi:hypothetical protein
MGVLYGGDLDFRTKLAKNPHAARFFAAMQQTAVNAAK